MACCQSFLLMFAVFLAARAARAAARTLLLTAIPAPPPPSFKTNRRRLKTNKPCSACLRWCDDCALHRRSELPGAGTMGKAGEGAFGSSEGRAAGSCPACRLALLELAAASVT